MQKLFLLGFLGLMIGVPSLQADDAVVNVYSYRQPFLMAPLFARFEARSGIKVNQVYAKAGLSERIQLEGASSPADVLLTSDFGQLMQAVAQGVAQPLSSETLQANIPVTLRDRAGYWLALTTRARVIYASVDPQRAPLGEVTDYQDLAKPALKGRVCTRSASHPYNIALIASLLMLEGENTLRAWLTGVKSNLARRPQGNDRAQVKAIQDGICDYAIGNSYYFGRMYHDEVQRVWAEAVRIITPNQGNSGTHINISGALIARDAPHFQNAVALLEFLSSREAQQIYAAENFEFPANPAASTSDFVNTHFGNFKRQDLPLDRLIQFIPQAQVLVHQTRFNQ